MSAHAAAGTAAPGARPRPAPRRPARRKRGKDVAWYVACLLVTAVTVVPLVWTVGTSLTPSGEILSGGVRLWPEHLTLDNYVEAFGRVPFGRYFLNSLIIGVGGAAANLLLGSLAGYAFARLDFRGRRPLFWLFISSMMVPSIVTMIPLFLVLRNMPLAGGNDILGDGGLGLINTFWAVILPGASGPFAMFMMKQHFEDMPGDYAEAARLDGAGELRIFTMIYLPLARPALAVLGVLTFQAGWNNFLWPLIVLNSRDMMTVQVGLAAFMHEYETDYGPLMAGTVIACIPVIVVFVLGQRWIVQGSTYTGVK
ncbi:MAG TPA: carbohydrate ABC transporter permease [Cellulomonas sp.]